MNDTLKVAPANNSLDRWAIFVSGLCVLHCLAIPAAVLLLPAVGSRLTEEQTLTHWLLLAVAVPISAIALGSGYRRHRSPRTLILGIVGLLLLTLGVSHWLGDALEIPLTVAGGIALIAAHGMNLRHHH